MAASLAVRDHWCLQCAIQVPRAVTEAVGLDADGDPACRNHALPETIAIAAVPPPAEPEKPKSVRKLKVVPTVTVPVPSQPAESEKENVMDGKRKCAHPECTKMVGRFNKSGVCTEHWYWGKQQRKASQTSAKRMAKPVRGGAAPEPLSGARDLVELVWRSLSAEEKLAAVTAALESRK